MDSETQSERAGAPDDAAQPPAAGRAGPSLLERLAIAVLIVALAGATYFRFTGLEWDHGQHLHPDERFLTMVASAWKPPESLEAYFDNTRNTLNPYNFQVSGHFVYGPLPVVMSIYAGTWLNQNCDGLAAPLLDVLPVPSFHTVACRVAEQPTGFFTGYDGVYLVGRVLSALSDLLAIFVLFLLGRRLYGTWVGVLAAVLMAGSVMLIQQAHYFTVDSFANLFVVLSMYFAVRASQSGRVWDYALFGVFVAGSVACKVNTAPLAAMIGVAAVLWVVRRVDTAGSSGAQSAAPRRWWPAIGTAALLVVISGAACLLTFRVLQPYSFGPQDQPTSFLRIFAPYAADLTDRPPVPGLNPVWWRDLQSARLENSGDIDSPPGKQWTNRTPLLFPWLNIVLWGMGLPLGLAGWIGWGWAGYRTLRATPAQDRRPEWHQHLLLFVWIAAYFVFMGTNTVKSMRYMLPLYPFLCVFAAWALIGFWNWARARARQEPSSGAPVRWRAVPVWVSGALIAIVVVGTWAWAFAFTRIYNRPITREAAARWIYANVPPGTTLVIAGPGGEQSIGVPIQPGYIFSQDGMLSVTGFQLKQGGVARLVRVNYLADPNGDPGEEVVRVAVSEDSGGGNALAENTQALHLEQSASPRGQAYDFPLSGSAALQAGRQYYLIVQVVSGAPVQVNTTRVANESWDDGLPLRVDGNDGFFNWYQGLSTSPSSQIEPYWEDDDNKRKMFIANLDEADYIFLSSSRAVWSVTRLPMRYPMMVRYYNALMDGSLGFDLVATFHSAPNIGPLRINDVTAEVNIGDPLPLPRIAYQPYFSAEEAFNVYDHPPVWIFRKNPQRYSSANTQAILNSVDLSAVVRLTPAQASQVGTLLLQSDDSRQANEAGGTWSQMFNRLDWLNQSPALAVIGWWLLIVLLGWAAFPLLSVVTGRLADRGFPLAKTAALLLIAWVGWWLSSLKLLPWTRLELVAVALVLAAVSAVIAWRRLGDFRAFVREQRWLILLVEAATLVFFLIFVAIRWQNPDLWHPYYGGEKPMDFAYLNAVIKTTFFPPYDPWFAGGYINYYYWGYVVVAVPIKLLGVVPASAYNLALPTLYALTAIGAFSAAYNLAMGFGRSSPEAPRPVEPVVTEPAAPEPDPAAPQPDEAAPAEPVQPHEPPARGVVEARPAPSLRRRAVVAGLIAALLVTTLGNLGEAQVILKGWEQLGLEGVDPSQEVPSTIPGVTNLIHVFRGLEKVVLEGKKVPVSTGQWYWDATRVINHDPGEAVPITEFPFFTFLYADLHAHMISLPLTLLALGLILGWLAASPGWGGQGGEKLAERMRARGPSLVLMAIAIGALRPVNTWDWPTYLAIAGAAFVLAEVRRAGRLTLNGLISAAVDTAVLFVLTMALYWPFLQYYAQPYQSAEVWSGTKTEIGPYLVVHGLLLFVLASFMLQEFIDWVRGVLKLGDSPRVDQLGLVLLAVVVLFGAVTAAAYFKGIFIAPVAVPLLALSVLLTLRPSVPDAPVSAERRAVTGLITLGLLLTLVVEVIVLKGDISRMNTVFKFYLQVWVLFGVTSGVALVWLWPRMPARASALRQAWTIALAVLVTCALAYPIWATLAKTSDRWAPAAPAGLDGMAFMPYATYADNDQNEILRYDYDAIVWIQDHVMGSPVIAEAPAGPAGNPGLYHWASRVSIYTGNPTIIGWDWHQRQQRAAISDDQVGRRTQDAFALYTTLDIPQAWALIQKYRVRYVYVGPVERAFYPVESLAKFDQMVTGGLLRVAYENDGARLYEVVSGG